MCVCNRDGEVMGVAERRMCKMCVCVTGGDQGREGAKVLHTHILHLVVLQTH